MLATLACVLQFVELGTRWNMTGVWPLTNLYGSLSLFSGLGVLIYIIFAQKYDLWLIGGGVLGISAIAFGYATTWNEGYMPAVPALQSYWIKVHVPIVVSSYASFMVAFVVSTLYLFKAYGERRLGTPRTTVLRANAAGAGNVSMTVASAPVTSLEAAAARTETPNVASAAAAGDPFAVWLAGLPSLARLDMLTYRIIAIGLVLLSVGIITGAMWANEAWAPIVVGSERNGGPALVDHLRIVHASAHAQFVAWREERLGEHRRLRLDHVLLSRRQHLDQRPAQLQDVARSLSW